MDQQMQKNAKIIVIVVILVLIVAFGSKFVKTVPPGHVAVATLFGEVQKDTYGEGLHIPVNPLYKWTEYDARQKTHTETAEVPSQDQLRTSMEISVQYRVDGKKAATILSETGTTEQAIAVHLKPKVRSLLREQGKSIVRAEDFFLEETQQQLQDSLTIGLQAYLAEKGLNVQAVLIREIRLPEFITRAIEEKKIREQEAEKQKAELARFKTEQQQLIAEADAHRQAAEQDAIRKKTLADAQAYEIEAINKAIANNPAYIQLEALKALAEISKDPAAKIYFINGDSPMPLPLMHMGITESKP